MKVLFRLNAGSCGLGHLTRNIAIFESLKERNIDAFFLIKSDDIKKITAFLKEEGITNDKFEFLPYNLKLEEDAEFTINFHKKGFSFVILDHYEHNLNYQQLLKDADIKWGQFDYKATDKIISNLIINANISAQEEDYLDIAKHDTILCIGYKYAIVRKSIANQIAQPQKNNILITMGGSALSKENRVFILTLLTNTDYSFEIISGDLELSSLVQKQPNCKLYSKPKDVSEIYKNCEVAVVAGGVTTFELAVLNIPMFIVPFVDNQMPNAKAWDINNFAMSFENVTAFKQEIEKIGLKSLIKTLKKKHSKKSISVDGLGASRIVAEILKITQ